MVGTCLFCSLASVNVPILVGCVSFPIILTVNNSFLSLVSPLPAVCR